MSFCFFYFLPLYSILISCSTFFVLVSVIQRQKLKKINQTTAFIRLKTERVEEEIEVLIDQRINDIIAGFKIQIPMASMFLSKNKETELKEMAKTELMKLFPALKQQFLKKIMNDSHDHSMPITEQLNLRGGQLVDSLWKEVKYPLLGIAVVVGLVLGLIEMALFFIVK